MKISFSTHSLPSSGSIVVGVLAEGKLLATAERIDRILGGAISRAIDTSRFTGKKGQTLTLMSPFGIGADRVVLIGLGEGVEFDELGAQAFGGRAWQEVGNNDPDQ